MNMAASLSLPFNPQTPVTPPPDHQTFGKGPLSPQVLKTFAQEVYGGMGGKLQHTDFLAPAARPVPLSTNKTPSSIPLPIPGLEALNKAAATTPPTSTASASTGTNDSQTAAAVQQSTAAVDPANDARYLAMASRIASYYQQRCQAVANYQQQRCQAWANMHRQKCQEMMQAAMLVVAWYIRDRISRKRKRAKRRFKRGLAEKCVTRPKVTKGESVRRWVLDVPSVKGAETTATGGDGNNTTSNIGNNSKAISSNPNCLPPHEKLLDREEAEFSMDKETAPDKDTKLFNVADNLIKSQLAKIDVPLLGALSFDESDSESDDEDMVTYRRYAPEDEEELLDEDEEMGEDEEEYYDDDDDDDDEEEEEEEEEEGADYEEEGMDGVIGSEEVHVGTGKGSRKRTRSSVS